MSKLVRLLLVLACLNRSLSAQTESTGTVSGTIVDQAAARPLEYVAVTLKTKDGAAVGRSAATDAHGAFTVEQVPFGEYRLSYGLVGLDRQESAPFTVDAAHRTPNLGQLAFAGDGVVKMEKFEVGVSKEAFYNSIDRKTYNVGKDIQSATGSASDLLQNVPSVQVDIEGNVSLRGDSNVLILINGKTSTLMGANRAAVLEQMPADAIDKIEVITNPSAKYKPDGTAGIINIALKKKHDPGYSASIRASVGNDRRFNAGVSANYNPGKYNLFGSYNVRQDDRPRFSEDLRRHLDPATNTFVGTEQRSEEQARPLSHLAQGGVDYNPDEQTKIGAAVSYNHRSYFRTATQSNRSFDATGAITSDYDRMRADPEFEQDVELTATYQHSFAAEGRELSVELKHDASTEQEDNHYANLYRTPATANSYDATRITAHDRNLEASADYTHPFDNGGKLETGYSREADHIDMDHFGSFLDPATNQWVTDSVVTNRFIYDSTIHAFYATYGRPFGSFGFLAGLRSEQTLIDTNQVTARLTDHHDYFRAYPSLHLTYNLSDAQQLQLNYSHRIHRPEGDDLNPYPEYQDPFNLHAGNPRLEPEEIHSIETGYQYKKESATYLATLYYRYQYHGMTDVTRYINATTLLTTKENLSKSSSGGLEVAVTRDLGSKVSLNFSGNAYYNVIDAGNLGFSGNRSTIAWNAKLNATWHASKTTLVQFNTNYSAKRLTAQGYRLPNGVANIGLKHDFADKKAALIFTVSDIFDSMKERTVIDTPTLHDEITRRRSARVAYVGIIYNFGKAPKKKGKDDTLPFDNAP